MWTFAFCEETLTCFDGSVRGNLLYLTMSFQSSGAILWGCCALLVYMKDARKILSQIKPELFALHYSLITIVRYMRKEIR